MTYDFLVASQETNVVQADWYCMYLNIIPKKKKAGIAVQVELYGYLCHTACRSPQMVYEVTSLHWEFAHDKLLIASRDQSLCKIIPSASEENFNLQACPNQVKS